LHFYICLNYISQETTLSGGWCEKTALERHVTDFALANQLAKFLEGKTVASYGEGPGEVSLLY